MAKQFVTPISHETEKMQSISSSLKVYTHIHILTLTKDNGNNSKNQFYFILYIIFHSRRLKKIETYEQ